MAQYNTLNVNFSNLQLNKRKPEIKNCTEIALNCSLNVIGIPITRQIFHRECY